MTVNHDTIAGDFNSPVPNIALPLFLKYFPRAYNAQEGGALVQHFKPVVPWGLYLRNDTLISTAFAIHKIIIRTIGSRVKHYRQRS